MSGDNDIGITDYPRRDIATHRWVARFNTVVALLGLIGFVYLIQVDSSGAVLIGGISLITAISAGKMDRKADAWEDALDEREQNGHETHPW